MTAKVWALKKARDTSEEITKTRGRGVNRSLQAKTYRETHVSAERDRRKLASWSLSSLWFLVRGVRTAPIHTPETTCPALSL